MSETKQKVNSFDVLKEMGERSLDLRLAPIGNICDLSVKGKNGYVTFGVEVRSAMDLINGKKFAGGFMMADVDQFSQVEKELSCAPSLLEQVSRYREVLSMYFDLRDKAESPEHWDYLLQENNWEQKAREALK